MTWWGFASSESVTRARAKSVYMLQRAVMSIGIQVPLERGWVPASQVVLARSNKIFSMLGGPKIKRNLIVVQCQAKKKRQLGGEIGLVTIPYPDEGQEEDCC